MKAENILNVSTKVFGSEKKIVGRGLKNKDIMN